MRQREWRVKQGLLVSLVLNMSKTIIGDYSVFCIETLTTDSQHIKIKKTWSTLLI